MTAVSALTPQEASQAAREQDLRSTLSMQEKEERMLAEAERRRAAAAPQQP